MKECGQMINPLIPATEELNSYMLALIVGKRAKQIIDGSPKLSLCESKNPITIAIDEYKKNMYVYTDEKFIEVRKKKEDIDYFEMF